MDSNTNSLAWDDADGTGITYPNSSTNSFLYNGEDLRVSKSDSVGTSAVITDGTSPASPVLKDARAVYTPGISERASGTSKFYHGDALGSTRGITNGSQTVTDAVLYDAFGMTVSRTGSTATPFGFVGTAQYQSDADSGLQLLGHRMYDPSVGRFISSDPIHAGTNWYTYCENDPLDTSDPTGLTAWGHLPPQPDPVWKFFDDHWGPNHGPTVGEQLGHNIKDAIQAFRDMLPAWPGRGGAGDGGETGSGGGGGGEGWTYGKAPQYVEPGIRELRGSYKNDLGQVEPWRAHYDLYGRQIGRTDYTQGNPSAGIPPVHHHKIIYGPGMRDGYRPPGHFPGPYVPGR